MRFRADAALFNIKQADGAVTFKGSPNFRAPAMLGRQVYNIINRSDGS